MKDTWIAKSRTHNGRLVVWIDQATDSNLLAANSRGVCFALTRDWIRNYTRFRVDRYNFVNSFGDADSATRIPQNYITDQQLHAANLKFKSDAFLTATRDALKNKQLTPDQALQRTNQFMRQLYGPECVNYSDFKDDGTNPLTIVLDFAFEDEEKGKPIPQYIMFTMKGTSSGHVVGFEMRPDVKVSENYPLLYEFFDANLGLFAFSNYNDMRNFFEMEVWDSLYEGKFSKFGVAAFDTGLGGLGKPLLASILEYLKNNAQRIWSRLWD